MCKEKYGKEINLNQRSKFNFVISIFWNVVVMNLRFIVRRKHQNLRGDDQNLRGDADLFNTRVLWGAWQILGGRKGVVKF